MRLASVQGWLVELGWDECCRPIKQTTTKLRCCIARMRVEAELSSEEQERSARCPVGQLGWVIPPGGSRLGPPEKRGEATELAEMIFTGGGRPGARVCCRCCLRGRQTACAGKPFGKASLVHVSACVRVRRARAASGLLKLEAARGRPSCLARSLTPWLCMRFGGVRVCVSAYRLLRPLVSRVDAWLSSRARTKNRRSPQPHSLSTRSDVTITQPW